ncbi:MAG: hypothetical protein ING26_19155 [Roseomonas sp.]|nr:hypothetical protein [Roseomonas sp.]
MSEWYDIETAPADEAIRVGWWEDYTYFSDKPEDLRWRTESGVPFRTQKFWIFRRVVRTSFAEKATHWQPLPEPPK